MSKDSLGQVVKRAIGDAAFRRQLQSDPEGALKGFDLTSDERAALRSGDPAKLGGFGIDQRMSKAFTLGAGAAGASRVTTSGDLSDSSAARSAFIDQGTGGGGGALVGDSASGGRAVIGDSAGGGRSALESTGTQGREGTAYITADEAGRDASPASLAASDSAANTAFMTSDEMGSGVTIAPSGDGDQAGDLLQPDASTDAWAENPEHQG